MVESEKNSLNLGENSWQRNWDLCVGCREERYNTRTLLTALPLGGKNGEWKTARALHRTRIEESDQFLGEFLFGRPENNTKRRTLLKTWNERQRLIRNRQENA